MKKHTEYYTFDNPKNPHARWGRIIKEDGNRVWLEFIGWGYKSELNK